MKQDRRIRLLMVCSLAQATPGSGGSSHSSWSQGSTPPTPLSNACLLVAAAVEPLGPAFKFPKTKKVGKVEGKRLSLVTCVLPAGEY